MTGSISTGTVVAYGHPNTNTNNPIRNIAENFFFIYTKITKSIALKAGYAVDQFGGKVYDYFERKNREFEAIMNAPLDPLLVAAVELQNELEVEMPPMWLRDP